MKEIKLDRRYAGGDKWKYALQFHKRDVNLFARYRHEFIEMFGLPYWNNPERLMGNFNKPMWLYNEHWNCSTKKRRIYYNNPALVTMIQLKMS